jgi:hypothetical protein
MKWRRKQQVKNACLILSACLSGDMSYDLSCDDIKTVSMMHNQKHMLHVSILRCCQVINKQYSYISLST